MPSPFRRAVWMDINRDIQSRKDAAAFVEWCQRQQIDLAFPCVNHCTGFMTYASDVAPRSTVADAWDPTAEVVEQCRKAGIETHAWVCIANWGSKEVQVSAAGPRPLPEAHRDWFCVDQTGVSMPDSPDPEVSRMSFLNLCRADVHDFHVRLCNEVLSRYDFDGYHLDYIRFTYKPARAVEGKKEAFAGEKRPVVELEGSARFSFDEPTLRAFDAETGAGFSGSGSTPAERVAWLYADESRREAWYAWKASKVTALVRRLGAETRRRGRKLSAAVFSGYPWCGQEVAQRWPGWVDERLLDLVVPMDYGLEPDAFVKTLEAQQAALRVEPRPAVPFIAGILGFEMFDGLSPEAAREKMAAFERLAREHAQSGISLYCYGRFRKLLG